MSRTHQHISDVELVLAANGELSPERLTAVSLHMESCTTCQARLTSFEGALGDFVEAHQTDADQRLPALDPLKADFEQRLEDLAANGSQPWLRWLTQPEGLGLVLAGACGLILIAASGFFQSPDAEHNPFTPDPFLTPGQARPVTLAQLCSGNLDETPLEIPREVALAVFRNHGIIAPQAGAYELDYLIPPELGGVGESANLWPQPYQQGPWNAYAKDALEDHLQRLVCAGELDLEAAQRAIAQDWTAAYQRYFETPEPLVIHATFLKDSPWE